MAFNLDTTELNRRWAKPDMIDSWSQMIIKHTDDSVDICTASSETGIYKILEDSCVLFLTIWKMNLFSEAVGKTGITH